MRKIGGYFVFIGVGLIVLPFIGLTIRFTDWIYNWGETTAWAIKIGLIVIGAALYFLGKPEVNAEAVLNNEPSTENENNSEETSENDKNA